LNLNFIIGWWGYTLDREDRQTSVTICIAGTRAKIVGKCNTGTERERVRERLREETSKARRILGNTRGSDM
jgi:hypothetical protein